MSFCRFPSCCMSTKLPHHSEGISKSPNDQLLFSSCMPLSSFPARQHVIKCWSIQLLVCMQDTGIYMAISTLLFDPESAIKKKLQFLTCRIMTYSALIKKSSRNNTLNFEIHNFFANAFESTLPPLKIPDLSQPARPRNIVCKIYIISSESLCSSLRVNKSKPVRGHTSILRQLHTLGFLAPRCCPHRLAWQFLLCSLT